MEVLRKLIVLVRIGLLPFVGCTLHLGVVGMVASAHAQSEWIDLDEPQNYVPRHEASFVQAGDKFYFFGGRESARRLDVYDYASNTWSAGRDAYAPIEFNHFQAVEYQGLIWVIGAFRTNSFPNEQTASSVYVFDPANREWMEGPEIPQERRRGSTGLVVHDDEFYIVGGNTRGHSGGYVPWFDRYDPQSGEWVPLEDAPQARDHFHAETANGKMYVIGGRRSGGQGGTFAPLIPEVDVYDFNTETWTTLPPESNLPTPRAAAAVATFDGKIMVMGGEGNGRAYDTVEAFDPSTNAWETLASMNFRRHGTQAIASGEGVFIVSGSPNQGGGNQRNMEVYNANAPAGEPSVAGVLGVPDEALVGPDNAEPIRLRHLDGNQGIFVNDITFSGTDAQDFSLTDFASAPFLMLRDGEYDLLVEYDGDKTDALASLDITFSGSQVARIPLRGTIVPEPSSVVLLLLGMLASLRIGRLRTSVE